MVWSSALRLAIVVTGVTAVPSSDTVSSVHGHGVTPGLITIWEDLFDAGSTIASKWTYNIGHKYPHPDAPDNWGTGEIGYHTDSEDNVRIDAEGGTSFLRITPLKMRDKSWTSGRIETTHDFTPAPGKVTRFEARIRLGDYRKNKLQGIWPAFWMLGFAYHTDPNNKYRNWPHVGEVDILENINGQSHMYNVVHCAVCNPPAGINNVTAYSRGQWHVVALEIDLAALVEKLTWFVDGAVEFEVTSERGNFVQDQESWEAVAHAPRFMILNVAVGGYWPGNPSKRTRGGAKAGMDVDFVRVLESA